MKKLLPFLVLFFTLNSFSQKEANFWYFGNNAALDFNSGSPVPVSGSQLSTFEGCSSFADTNGNLMFYVGAPSPITNNLTIWDKNNNPMPNGVGLQGDASSSQAALTIPAPGKPNTYFLFTVGAQSSDNAGFWYYTIDMSANGGLGEVVAGPVILGRSVDHRNWSEKITAVRAKECNAFWVISAHEDNFYAYKVDASGVNVSDPIVSRINGYNSSTDPRGYLKVSPDGTKLVSANMRNGAFLFDFNDDTGEVTNFNNTSFLNRFSIPGNVYGVEFSTSSRRLYLSTGDFQDSTEFLYQYDLTKPTINEINGSSFQVYNYFNSRGALQLGPDGKIYWTSNESNFISVINKPEELGADCDYSHQTVKVGENFAYATQGLPPFLSSLLLPIELVDSEDNTVINNQDLEFCIGENKTIVSEAITGSNITYQWTFDNGTSISTLPNTKDLILNNVSTANAGRYSFVVELTDDCGNITKYEATFNVGVFEAATATKPEDLYFCDTDNDGFNTFDLSAEKDAEILNGLDSNIFEVLYFENLADANSGNNLIVGLYTNQTAFSSQTIYARVQNKKATDACFDVTEFTLAVTGLPTPTQPEPYRICDDLESGSDTDGIVNTFLLNTKDAEILGPLSNLQYKVSYHSTLIGAETNEISTVIDKNTNLTVTNNKTVFIRVENVDNAICYNASLSLELIVDSLPILKPNPELDQCISANNTNPSVNLTLAEINISETPNVTFEYFKDAAGLNQIINTTSYPVQVNSTETIFVKVLSNQGCFRKLVELKINVGQTPDNPYNEVQTAVCDDFLDANGNNTGSNSDTDGITNFFLDKTNIENSINAPANTEIFYYENSDDRNNSLNEIDITNYRNNINKINLTTIPEGIQFPIYYKIISTINNDCQGLGEFYLQIHAVPNANTVIDIEKCDDALSGNTSDGRNANINLRSKIAEILKAGQTEADYNVTFHTTESGAINDTDIIVNDTNYTNEAPTGFTPGTTSEQTIFVRVENRTGSMCYNANTSFKIIIQPIPTVPANITDLITCDVVTVTDADSRNRIVQNIDLTSRDAEILNGRTGLRVEYYITQQDAENRTNIISDPTNFQNTTAETTFPADFNTDDPGIQTIFFIIVDENGLQCPSVFSTFQLLVYPEPFVNPISIYSDCDNNDDGDDTNGIIQNIDLNGKIPEILGSNRNTNDYNVTFYATASDVQSGSLANALPSPYTNSNRNETIYVRVQNKTSLCVNDDTSFEIIINPLPNFTVTSPQIVCLNNTPLTIAVENPAEIYTYEWRNAAGDIISFSETADVVEGGNYTVTATTTNGTNCTRIETIEVKESNPATLLSSFVAIIDEGNNIGSEDNLSIQIDTITNDLGPGEYQFALRNDDKNTTTPFQDEPLFENLEGGIYTIIVNDKNGCVPDATLQVSVIQFPKFFTPNGDGKNDTWVVKGANQTFYPNSSINIFNRYGKLVAQIPIDSQGWNGTYNGKTLPSDDYWYNVTLIPADSSKPNITKKGNFSLLRR